MCKALGLPQTTQEQRKKWEKEGREGGKKGGGKEE